MSQILSAFLLGLRQLGDSRVLAILFKSIAASLVLFVIVAVAGWYAFDWAIGALGLSDTLFAGAGVVREALSLLLALAGLWLTWRIVAMAVIQFYADDVVEAVEARFYPEAAGRARTPPLAEQVRASLKAAGRALLANLIALPFAIALLVTGVGTFALFLVVNGVLIGRELQDMVWQRHHGAMGVAAGGGAHPLGKMQRFLLGGITAAMLAIPGVNFLAPLLGAASATHLIHRKDATANAR
ncbi:EI24 domain-containing protein [Paraurantiacibacter namhicola]|uniref:CysZ-like protein n=1 Tax=Paraurantiacibacter namhicola TaxID=645517 RepID=A0A1C7D663_9SPHN|nr:EI24 domain-containing protein [Paraurantiacibacter namhicola]ANU06803.1 CysZ-like protein [Paraurantiacibacter namhicola]